MTPDSGPPGTVVVFEGRNLQPLDWVQFDGAPAEFRSISATRFEAVAPPGVTRGRVTYGIDGRRQWGPVFRPTEGSPPPPPPPPGDTEPPSAPTNVRMAGSATNSVTFAWDASTDNVGVTGYSLFRDGTLTGTTTSTTVTYNGLPCGRSLTFGVNAFDAAGNHSATITVNGSTANCPPPTGDTTPPSAPGNLRSTGATETSITVAWNASTDNVGVAGYGLYRNGSAAGTTTGTTTTFSGLVCGTTYSLGVEAYDAANNRSPRSTVNASTSTCTTPPPPGGGTCTIASTAGCVPGATLTFRDTQFRCDRPLSSYGRLPLKVVLEYTPGRVYNGNGAVDLITGCVGDGNSNTIDLIVDVRGDGRTYGPGQDALKVRLDARDIQITGHADCGRREGDAHQDGIQLQGGTNIAFVDFTVGNYDAGLSTCQGAGGAFFYSGANGYTPQGTHVIRGKYIGCNHSLLMGSGSGSVADASFRSGRTDGTDPVCTGYAASPACQGGSASIPTRNLTCENWNRTARRWEP